uniref:photosystem II assembly protein Psb34 n=1 Tax=Trichocoleus desertorum TaxID=1481672 RepID=UPI0025B4B2B9|nr:ssl1498 family light-harvesting-like protein [Trichocoleus desertorum]
MRYTTEEGGRLNNFAVEPKMYQAEPPTKAQQRNFLILGVVGTVLVGGLIFVAFSVSNLS